MGRVTKCNKTHITLTLVPIILVASTLAQMLLWVLYLHHDNGVARERALGNQELKEHRLEE